MRFCTSYKYLDKTWSLIIDAESLSDAEKRCKQLNLSLDGELVFTYPAIVPSSVIDLICRVRNKLHENRVSKSVKKLLKNFHK